MSDYIKEKVEILKEFCIALRVSDYRRLLSAKSEIQVDNIARSIILNRWEA